MRGIMVTHFSFGSFLFFQGCSTSPFRTLLEWKYLCGIAPRMADEEPKDEAGLELKGEANGFGRGAGEMPSSNGFLAVSGVPGLMGLAVRVVVVVVALPL